MKGVIFPVLLLASTQWLSGQITFDFFASGSGTIGAGADLDGLSAGTSSVGGVILTAEAFQNGVSSGTVFNGTSSSFGINALGSDDSDEFDNDLGAGNADVMQFSFSTGGTFESIDLRGITSNASDAEAILSFTGGGTFDLFGGSPNESNGTSDIYTISETFASNQLITLTVSGSAPSNTSFGLDGFTISTSAIPEPSTYALIFGGIALGLVVWKRRKASVEA